MVIKNNLKNQHPDTDIYAHGGNIAQEAKRLGINPNEIIDASASLVPFAPTQEINTCIIKTLRGTNLKCYPEANLLSLKQAIANWHKIEPSMVIPGNGAAELITWAARDSKEHGLSTLPSPGFSDYKRALQCWNCPYQEIQLPLSWNEVFPQNFPLTSSSEVIWITNPHNPTGQLWSRDSLEKIVQSHRYVICDEAFLPLVPNGESHSLIPLVTNYPNLIVIRSLTKLFSIAGLRLGYAISRPERLERWEQYRDPWPLNALAIAVGITLFNNRKVTQRQIEKVNKWITKESPWLHSKLGSLVGITAHPSSTNFQLIQGNSSLILLKEKLAQNKILVRDCRSFVGLSDEWLRVSLQTRRNNNRIFNEIKRLLN